MLAFVTSTHAGQQEKTYTESTLLRLLSTVGIKLEQLLIHMKYGGVGKLYYVQWTLILANVMRFSL